MLSYLHHLVYVAYHKLSGNKLSDHQPLVEELIRLRLIMEKIKPIDTKLSYQVQKVVKKAEASNVEDAEEADVVNGAAFHPLRSDLDLLTGEKCRSAVIQTEPGRL